MAGHKKIGAMLSGGIDSSLISAISAKHAEEPINTFYVKFDNDKNSESVWAQKISKHIGSIHNELKFSSKEAIEYIPKMIFNMMNHMPIRRQSQCSHLKSFQRNFLLFNWRWWR